MNQRERQILNRILTNEIAKISDSLIPEARDIIKSYEMFPNKMKKAQMRSLVNIAQNTQSIGDVTSYIEHQTTRHDGSWGKQVQGKAFGKAVKEKINKVAHQDNGILQISFDKLQKVLKEQNRLVTSDYKQEESDILQYIRITLLRKFIQHLSASYEVEGD